MNKIQTGKFGEEIAARYLAGLGYLIIAKNHKEKFDEIDIIARHPNEMLIFCEVKTSTINSAWLGSSGSFMPEDHLNSLKLKRLIRGARMFLARHPNLVDEERGWQIDLVGVYVKNEIFLSLNHYENI
jgi:putative endonuclease